MKKANLIRTNRILSVVLALAMLLSMVTIGGFTASANETAPEIWDGTTVTAPRDSDSDGVYEITNGAELKYAIFYGGNIGSDTACKFILTNDIYLNDINEIDWATGAVNNGYTIKSWFETWTPGETDVPFSGTIDGNYHTIYGMYLRQGNTGYTIYQSGAGLVPMIAENSNVTIKNLGIDYAYVQHEASASAFVGVAPSGAALTIDSCYAGNNVYLDGCAAGVFRAYARNAGGMTLSNSYSLANITAREKADGGSGGALEGLIAEIWESGAGIIVSGCYNANGCISNHNVAAEVIDAINCYQTESGGNYVPAAEVIGVADMQGPDALTNMSKLNNFGNYYVETESYPELSAFHGIKVNEIWNGTTKQPADSDSDGVYEITNGAELAYIISTGGGAGKSYKLTADIYLNNLDKVDWKTGVADEGYTPNKWYKNIAFQGSINGDGHVVYGLYFNDAPVGWGLNGVGLVPEVNVNTTVSITELGIESSFLSGENGVSAFVGCAGENVSTTAEIRAQVLIDQCYVGEDVTVKGYDTGAFRGATRGSNTVVTNSYSLATLEGTMVGIIGGEGWDSTITVENVYGIGKPNSEAWRNYYTFKNVYVTDAGNYPDDVVAITTDNMKDIDVFSNEAKMPKLNSSGKFVANKGYPTLVAFLGYDIIIGDEVWDGTTSAPVANSDGVYEIGTAEELAYIIENGGAAGANYKLTSDIYLNALDYIDWATGEVTPGYVPKPWYYNTAFQGNIDGDGHTVYGLYYNVLGTTGWGYEGIGLVPRVNDGTSVKITNLAVDNAYVSAINGVSAFVGIAGPTSHQQEAEYANVVIENCYAGENVTLKGNHAGVFRGSTFRANTTIANCYTLATTQTLSVAEGAAGIFGNEWTSTVTLKNVFNANGGVGGQDHYLANKNFTGVYATSILAGDGKEYVPEAMTVLTANNMKGRDALENPAKLKGLNSDNAFEATKGYPILVAFIKEAVAEPEDETVKIWDGTDKEPTNSDAQGNVLINSAEELAYIIENGSDADTTYKLTTNIYLNDVDKINWVTGEPIGDYVPNTWYENYSFQGTLDGDGFMVYGLYSNIPDTQYTWGYWGQGLIPRVDSGTTAIIKNLGIDKAYIRATNAGGAFVGFAGPRSYADTSDNANVTIEQCFVGENVCVNAYTAGAFVGAGLRGVVDVKNSYSLAEVNSTDFDGCAVDFAPSGFVGNDWSMTVTVNNSYNAKGTLQGWWDNTTYQNSKNNYATGYDIDKTASGGALEAYYATKLDAANMQGLDALTNGEKMWKLNADSVYTATKGYPELTIFIQRGNSNAFRIWDGTTMVPTNGSGTKANPYLISYAAELAYIISSGGEADAYYKLTNDIYLNNIYMIDWATGEAADGYTPNSWYENIAFQGNIDGNGYVVYGLYYNDGAELGDFGYYYNSGLIPRVNDGNSVSVKNLGIDNAFVHAAQGASAFVGFAGATGNYAPEVKAQVVIDNCYTGSKVYLEGGCTGVFRAGERGSNTVVTNSYSLANTVGAKYDGLLGNFWSATASLNNVYNANGPVTTQTSAPITAANVYATNNDAGVANVDVITADQMIGENALDTMNRLDSDVFKAIPNYYPILKEFAQNKLVKNNRVYYGVALNDALDFYITESGEQYFWHYGDILINDDSSMDIVDLVFLTLQVNAGTAKADIDGDNDCTTDDLKILRKALIGVTDYIDCPMYSFGNYTPYGTTLSSEYQFVWGDEFDGDYLNTQKWGIYGKMNGSSQGYAYTGSNGKYEFDWDTPVDYTGDVVCSDDEKAIAVEDGNLRLTAYKTDDGNYVVPTSVVTQNTMNFKYGYVEIRAKFPVQDGIWSSWWTKSVFDKSDTHNLAYPETSLGAEVDMIEVFDTDQATFNIIKWWENEDGSFGSWYPNDAPRAHKQTITNDRYYVFGYEWTEDEVIMYCDGVEYGRYDISEPYTEIVNGRNTVADTSGTGMEGFDAHQFLIFNNHLFYPTVSSAGMFITENTDFTQADYLIDYCRVYQKPGIGDIVTK